MSSRAEKVARGILTLGIVWGISSLLVGLAASFVLNGINLLQSMLALVTACIAPLAVAILAIWNPKAAAVILIICFLVLEGLGLFSDGFSGIVQITRRFGIQNVLFICAYMFVAHVDRAKGQSLQEGS